VEIVRESTDIFLRQLIERAGAEFIGVQDGSVLFRDPQGGTLLRLFRFACTSENIQLSLKNARERDRQTSRWEVTNK
jgi:hypothetical protein